jgi:hypothetical protein
MADGPRSSPDNSILDFLHECSSSIRATHRVLSHEGGGMPHAKPEDLPVGGGGRWPSAGAGFRSAHWGDLEVGFTTVEAPLDCAELYRLGGMPGGVCPCPHYGYVFTGSIRATYPNTELPDEIASAGEAYFFPAGHVLIYEEPTTAFEVNPAFALSQCMEAIERAARHYLDQAN